MKNTKEVFAESLKKMLKKKRLDHISVKDIAEDCGVSRQAFYYHFDDIYDLVEWTFLEETKAAIANNRDFETWQQAYCNVLEWLRSNKTVVVNSYCSMSPEYLRNFMYKILFEEIYPVIEKPAKDTNVNDKQIKFISRFCSLAVVAMGLDWVRTGMKEDPEEIVKQVAMLVKGIFTKELTE